MNSHCKEFIQYIINESPRYNKAVVENAASERFGLIKDRKIYHNEYFAVRFSYSKARSVLFSNTVLSLSALEKYDRIPFFVVLVRQCDSNVILLSNSTFLKKISHSSHELSMTNIKGSFNGSDIMRKAYEKDNSPENFDYLFATHQGLDWTDNLARLVDATSRISSNCEKFWPNQIQIDSILTSINRSKEFIGSHNFNRLKEDLDLRCQRCRNEILIASRIENVNIRGRLIESLITSDDAEYQRIVRNLHELESALPTYDTRNGLGDYCRTFEDINTLTDIKTKIIYLNSNPKAYNIDKFLRQMADGRSILLFYFIGVDENRVFNTLLCSVYHHVLVENTILQFHWAGRSSRGVAQFNGEALNEMLHDPGFRNNINKAECKQFVLELLSR